MEEDTFNWRCTIQWSSQPPDTLCLGTTEVARLHQRVNDKTWFATLDQHLDYEKRRRRDCTSYESGKAGAMTWALRHEARIRREIEERRAKRRR
ncbi:hypothetical protein [Pseudoxanthomonas sacheonensis]|uniref:Uncharacterized protein n=1 Tax=Pseudoxanthomonas sacheonensis TaxID=443615 RepID=A0ABU1RUF8_9GAMM|nr:hypothetical protein [Pseudoxanthomonas sacheonensis]MDR6842408.1 hypothetical protein [Pseudoxanthomonas sacheonensis]